MKDNPLLGEKTEIKNYSSISDKYNIIIMGEAKTGKTELLKSLSSNKFENFQNINLENNYQNNIDKISLEYKNENKRYVMNIWNYCNIPNQMIINNFMKKADAFIIIYSVIDKNSFNNIQHWIEEAKSKALSKKIKIFIIGNNFEENNEREVGVDEVKQLVEDDGYKIFEISVKNKNEIEDTFNDIFSEVSNIVYVDYEYMDFTTSEDNKKTTKKACCCKTCNIF